MSVAVRFDDYTHRVLCDAIDRLEANRWLAALPVPTVWQGDQPEDDQRAVWALAAPARAARRPAA